MEKKELLTEEFKSLGFYISDHPLKEYKSFNQLQIISYNRFLNNHENEGLVAGTIMSIQEKKSSKGTPYGIVKFSDKEGEFELFLFSEILINNRDKLKESESMILTLQKDVVTSDEKKKKRINVRKIVSLEEALNKPYSKVIIELKDNYKIDEIKNILSDNGDTQIKFVVYEKNKKAHYSLQNNRKFDLKHFKALKAKEYVSKITV